MNSAGERLQNHLHLLKVLMDRDGLSPEAALELAGGLIPAEDHRAVLELYREQSSTRIVPVEPNIISDGGPRAWFEGHDTSKGYYWRRQRSFLAHVLHRKDYEIDSLDRASDHVLAHLESPNHPTPFNVRGLVIGYVQSGKTANFSAVIAKAADAGYKIVIVLSGLHNSLRRQTQQRLERDLGRESIPGVGLPEAGRRWVWGTGAGLTDDFDPSNFSPSILQGNDQVIFVVKKNKSRLERLIGWMRGHVPPEVPVLVIDDEADQASINTKGDRPPLDEVDLTAADFEGEEPDPEEISPSAINYNIRMLLNLFARKSFVAYTATPFANVLIDPLATDRKAGTDLFPEHFIISLPPPPGESYVGPAELFGRDKLAGEIDTVEQPGLDVIETVPDHEVQLLIPGSGQGTTFVPTVPPSMRQALVDYVLATAGRLERSGQDVPCTMLVHTHQGRAVQNALAPLVREELAHMRQRWLYEAEEFRPQLRKRWIDRFEPVSSSIDLDLAVEFDEIEPHLDRVLRDSIEVKVLNMDSLDQLDFEAEPAMKAVLIGGNKLSRGVTLEGLMVSYFVRESPYYDTLMQMGRWFGYRGSYIDLTRIYSTELLVSWFHDLATAETELRRQIGRYEREPGLTPMRFVPKVRKHPSMLVTAKAKMRDAVEASVSFAGQRIQTLRWPLSSTPQQTENLQLTRKFFSDLGRPEIIDGQPVWRDVPSRIVLGYLNAFMEPDQRQWDRGMISEYITKQNANGELRRWLVLVSCARTGDSRELWWEDLGVLGMPRVPLIARTRLKSDRTSLGVVTDPADELLGLSDEQKAAAAEAYAEGLYSSRAEAYRGQRDPNEGLLVLYPISPASQPRRNSRDRVALYEDPPAHPTLLAYALSFPFSDSEATVEYYQAPLSTPVTA